MDLRIVRHAESTANAQGRWQGRHDYPLSDLGRQQASRLRDRFESEDYLPTRIYSSPLSRTLETAQVASSIWDLPITQVDDLIETDVGICSGMTWEEIETRMPDIAVEFAKSRDLDMIEGAETFAQRSTRARRVVDRMIADHTDEDTVLVFSHGGIIQNIFAQLMRSDRLWGLGVRNTAVFDFSIAVDLWHLDGHALSNNSFWRIRRFNDASHLD